MRRIERPPETECWVDIFELSHFMGRMRRLFGPLRLKRLSARSVIVGPLAQMQLTGQRRGQEVTLHLKPNRLVPDLTASLGNARPKSAAVYELETEKSSDKDTRLAKRPAAKNRRIRKNR